MGHLLRLSLITLWGLVACAGTPTQEMSDARQMIQAAREGGAERFAPAYLARARRALEDAQKALEVRDFRKARRRAEEARRWAARAQAQAQVFREAEGAVSRAEEEGRLTPEVEALWREAMQAARAGEDAALPLARKVLGLLR